MRPARLDIEIGRLVLDAGTLADARRVAAAVEAELARLAGEGAFPSSLLSGPPPRTLAGPEARGSDQPHRLGADIARSIHSALGAGGE